MTDKKTKADIDNKSIKVFQAAKWYFPDVGGIETVARIITEAFEGRAEVDVLVCSASKKKETEVTEGGTRIYRAKTPIRLCSTPISLDYIRTFAKMSRKADLIQLHAPFPLSDLALFLCRGRKKQKKVLWYHSDVVKQRKMMFFYRPLLKWMLKKMDRIYVASRAIAEQSEYLGPHMDKVEVIPFGIPIDHYLSAKTSPVLSEIATDKNSVKILFVGRLVYYKGVDILIKSMVNTTGAELFIIGSGELEDKLKEQVAELGIDKKIHFLGHVEDNVLLSAYADCDVFVLPSISRAECFGLVQLEAMIYGKPVINTALPTAVPEVSISGQTGLTVPPEDENALSEAIRTLTDDAEMRQKMGEQARERCKTCFSIKQMMDRVYDSYLSLL